MSISPGNLILLFMLIQSVNRNTPCDLCIQSKLTIIAQISIIEYLQKTDI